MIDWEKLRLFEQVAEAGSFTEAARRLGPAALAGAVMYSSSRPCPMCQAAAHWAGVARLVYGTALEDGGPPRLAC